MFFRTSESRKSAFSLAGLMSTSFLGVIASSSSTCAKERRDGTRCCVVLGRTERDERRIIVDRWPGGLNVPESSCEPWLDPEVEAREG